MVGMVKREFKCSLCEQTFEQYGGDLMIPKPELCDSCLQVVWPMDETTLNLHVAGCLEKVPESFTTESVVQLILWHRSRWTCANEAIKSRDVLIMF